MRLLAKTILFTTMALTALGIHASEKKGPPLRIIVPYAAGGGTDMLARQLSIRLEAKMNRTVMVENKAGGATVPAALTIISSPADGNTVALFDLSTVTMNQHLFKKPPYDPETAFKPVTKVADIPHALLVPANSSVTDLADFVAQVKSKQIAVFGSPGSLSGSFLLFEEFLKRAGLSMEHSGYRGSAPALQELIGGQLPAAFLDINSAIQHIKSGKVRALAVATVSRLDLLPNVPTFGESGYAGYLGYTWYGVFMHGTTPDSLINQIGDAVREVTMSADMKKWLESQTLVPSVTSSPEFKQLVREDSKKFGAIIRTKGLSLD